MAANEAAISTKPVSAVGDDSSESDGETEPAKSFHRRFSTNKNIKSSVSELDSPVSGRAHTWSQPTAGNVESRPIEAANRRHPRHPDKKGHILHSLSFSCLLCRQVESEGWVELNRVNLGGNRWNACLLEEAFLLMAGERETVLSGIFSGSEL